MKSEGLRPVLTTFNTLLKACMRAHDGTRAEQVLSWIREAGLPPDEYTFTTLIKAFSYSVNILRVLQVTPCLLLGLVRERVGENMGRGC